MLWQGEVQSVIDELQKQSLILGLPTKKDTNSSPRRVLPRNANSYFPNNREAMDYPRFRAKGWPIGLIAAINRDLIAMIQEGRFREELYGRLNTMIPAIPPLRERT